MAKTKPVSRKNVIPTSNYGLVNEMAMIPPPAVGDDETSTASDQETQNAPADTITETPTDASETPPTADSAAITETPTHSSEPPTALGNKTTENLPTEAQMITTTAPSDIDMETTIAPSETGNESSNGPSTIAPTETPTAGLGAQTNLVNDNHLIRDNYMNFQLPSKIDYLNKDFLLRNIINNNELCFMSFKGFCECYFPQKFLMQLANLTCGSAADESSKFESFFVCIGTKKGYNSVLKVPFNSKRNIDRKKTLYIDKSPDYQNLFVPFLNEMLK